MNRIRIIPLLACAFLAAPLAAQESLSAGDIGAGTLDEGDPRMDNDAPYEAWVLRGRPGQALVVRMESEEFDTSLYWGHEDEDGDWVEVAANDDWGEGTDSRLVVRLDGRGQYELRAAAFDEDGRGEYVLRVRELAVPSRVERIRVGDEVSGELAESDEEGENGIEDHYLIQGRAGQTVTLLAESDDFDTYLSFGELRDGGMADAREDDDGGEGTNSQLVVVLGGAADNRVIVRSFGGDALGAYTLRVLEGDQSQDWDEEYEEEGIDEEIVEEDSIATETAPVVESGGGEHPFRTGQPVEGRLGDGVPQDEDGRYYEEYIFRARAGERIAVAVSSDEFDPFVQVGREMGDDFEPLAEDDDSGPDLDAELTWSPETSGVYTVRVTSALDDATGAYVLRVLISR